MVKENVSRSVIGPNLTMEYLKSYEDVATLGKTCRSCHQCALACTADCELQAFGCHMENCGAAFKFELSRKGTRRHYAFRCTSLRTFWLFSPLDLFHP